MESWGPERGWGGTRRVLSPEPKPISGPLWSDALFPFWQPFMGAISQGSLHRHINEHSLLWVAAVSLSPKSSWSISQHMDNIQPSHKAGRRKPITMNKCSGKPPSDSPNELRQSKPSSSSCFTEQADCLSRIRWGGKAGWWSLKFPWQVLGIEFTFLCVPAAVRGMKEHCAETVSCWRLWFVQHFALC